MKSVVSFPHAALLLIESYNLLLSLELWLLSHVLPQKWWPGISECDNRMQLPIQRYMTQAWSLLRKILYGALRTLSILP